MTRKNKNGLIIAIVFLMLLFTLILTSSIGGITYLRDLEYLMSNGREVEGDILELKTGKGYSNNDGWLHYSFTLYYQYEENGNVWKARSYWEVREDKTDKLNEIRTWCKSQVGKNIKLIIDDKGHCIAANELQSKYKGQYNFVWLRGGIFIGIEAVLLISLIVIIFKVKVKDHLGNSL